MATFTFLSGRGVAHKLGDPRRSAQAIWRGAVWPYLLWGSLFLIAQTAAGGLRNAAGTVAMDWSLLWTPIAWLWFLYAAAVFHLAALLLHRWPRAMLAVSLGLLALIPFTAALFARQLLFLFSFYAAGIVWGRRPMPAVPFAGPIAAGGMAACWALGVADYSAVLWPFAALWMLATFAWSARACGSSAAVLAWLGQRSMAIYVSHFFFISAVRIALQHGLGITSFAVNVPLGFAAGLGGSLAVLAAAQRLRLAPLLGLGGKPGGHLPAANS